MSAVETLIIGAGHRGRDTFGYHALEHPDELRVIGVAEPNRERRELFVSRHPHAGDLAMEDWRDLLARPQLCPAAIIATQDEDHVEPALAAIEAGYHVLLEKPMAVTPIDCMRLVLAAEKQGVMLQVGHVLRYTAFYSTVQRLVAEGAIGDLITIEMNENVAFWHNTHSYVRGKWRYAPPSAPMIMAKCCHDLDLMTWFVGDLCASLASYGSNRVFRPENAPHPDVPERCIDGCPVQEECPHDAVRYYVNAIDYWPWRDVALEPTEEARTEALRTGPYGECVYKTGKTTVDHQVIAARFGNDVTATFTMQGFATSPSRTLRLSGTEGDMYGNFEDRRLHVGKFRTGGTERMQCGEAVYGHSDGDEGLCRAFVDCVRRDAIGEVLANGRVALDSHLMGFAAEEARVTGEMIDMDVYRARMEAEAQAAGVV